MPTPGTRDNSATEILSQPFLLNVIAFKAVQNVDDKVNIVMSAAVDGIPIAHAIDTGFVQAVKFVFVTAFLV